MSENTTLEDGSRSRKRFKLVHGQFFAKYRYKNLQWELDGKFFGFGDLSDDDIIRIQEELKEGETFMGWNEHHGTQWQQTTIPMIVITHSEIKFREDLVKAWKEEGIRYGHHEENK